MSFPGTLFSRPRMWQQIASFAMGARGGQSLRRKPRGSLVPRSSFATFCDDTGFLTRHWSLDDSERNPTLSQLKQLRHGKQAMSFSSSRWDAIERPLIAL